MRQYNGYDRTSHKYLGVVTQPSNHLTSADVRSTGMTYNGVAYCQTKLFFASFVSLSYPVPGRSGF